MRTRLSSWQIKEREENNYMKYVEVKYTTIAHLPESIVTYQINFPQNVEGFNIKSIKVKSEENALFNIVLLDADNNDKIYESFYETQYHYDNVDLVYKPNNKYFLVRIHNQSLLTTKYHIEIKGIEVK